MLYHIIGAFLTAIGILWFIKPEMLRKRLQKKMTRRLKWIGYLFIFVFGCSLLFSALKTEGLLVKAAGIAGLMIAVNIMNLLITKSSKGIAAWWQHRPTVFFRIWAVVIFSAGLVMILK